MIRFIPVVLSALSTYTRPTSDITVDQWIGSDGLPLYHNIDETAYNDVDYIQSPDVATPVPVVFGLSQTLPAGTWTVRVRAMGTNGTGNIVGKLQNSSSTTVGTSSTQALTGSFATYPLSITTTGAADRIRIEVS